MERQMARPSDFLLESLLAATADLGVGRVEVDPPRNPSNNKVTPVVGGEEEVGTGPWLLSPDLGVVEGPLVTRMDQGADQKVKVLRVALAAVRVEGIDDVRHAVKLYSA